jgi:hypothetical protein
MSNREQRQKEGNSITSLTFLSESIRRWTALSQGCEDLFHRSLQKEDYCCEGLWWFRVFKEIWLNPGALCHKSWCDMCSQPEIWLRSNPPRRDTGWKHSVCGQREKRDSHQKKQPSWEGIKSDLQKSPPQPAAGAVQLVMSSWTREGSTQVRLHRKSCPGM